MASGVGERVGGSLKERSHGGWEGRMGKKGTKPPSSRRGYMEPAPAGPSGPGRTSPGRPDQNCRSDKSGPGSG
jgi:hypothetical protein